MTIETKFMERAPVDMGGHVKYVILKNENSYYMIHRGDQHEILVSVVIENGDGSFSAEKTADGIYNASLDKVEPKSDFQKLIGRFFDKYPWYAGPVPEETGLEKFIENLRFNGAKHENK